jgi:hypothetical protein
MRTPEWSMEPRPFEKLAQLEHLIHGGEGRHVAALGHDPRVLIFDFAPALGDLLEDHPERLQQIERFEAGNHDGP